MQFLTRFPQLKTFIHMVLYAGDEIEGGPQRKRGHQLALAAPLKSLPVRTFRPPLDDPRVPFPNRQCNTCNAELSPFSAARYLDPALHGRIYEAVMVATSTLIPLSQVPELFPEGAKPSRATVHRWSKRYPGLTIRIAGHDYMQHTTAEAIGSGVPLADAARAGAEGERAA